MNVLLFTGYYLPGYKGGGPIKTIKNLVDEVGDTISFTLITNDRDLGDVSPYKSVNHGVWNKVGNAKVFYISPKMKSYMKIFSIISNKNYNVIYLNSFFSIRFSFIPSLLAKMLDKKVILSPRGELSVGALSLKYQKKRVFINFYKFLKLHQGLVIQASSDYEAQDIRKVLGSNVDVQIAENIGAQQFVQRLPQRKNDNISLVSLSRISPMKNILVALEVLKNVKQNVSYDIYGPIEDKEYWVRCERAISKLPSNIQVEYKGKLHPHDVINTISAYDMFFMPTKGENYGHVIAEALCAGLPILIADTTPWRNLQEQGIGWDLSLDNMSAFSDAIDQLALMDLKEHHKMRKHVLQWAKNKFSQRGAIDANIAMFNYAANK